MKKSFIISLILLMSSIAIVSAKDQNADDIARALVERLTCPHMRVVIKDHELMYYNIEEDSKRAQLLFNGNKVFLLKIKISDTVTDVIEIGENVIELKGNGPEKIYLNKAGRSLYFKDPDNDKTESFGKVSMAKRSGMLRATLDKHEEMRIDICMRYNKAVLYFVNHPLYRLSFSPFPIIGQDHTYVFKLSGDGDRPIYLNTERKILYFREDDSSRPGQFANVEATSYLTMRH